MLTKDEAKMLCVLVTESSDVLTKQHAQSLLEAITRSTSSSRWRHYKGGEYDLVCEAIHADSLDILPVYRQLATGRVFVRDHAAFYGKTVVGGTLVNRFNRIVQPGEEP